MPDIGLPGMPGFRFPDLPKFELPSLDLSEWDLSMPDLIPDWDGDSEEERQEPHKRAKHQDKVTVEISLVTEEGDEIPSVGYEIDGAKNFHSRGILDATGKCRVEIPKGDYTVRYLDPDSIYGKTLAMRLHKALANHEFGKIVRVLMEPREVIKSVQSAYDNAIRKSGEPNMIIAINKAAEGKPEFNIIQHQMRKAGIGSETGALYSSSSPSQIHGQATMAAKS
jgi:hypothetical protein